MVKRFGRANLTKIGAQGGRRVFFVIFFWTFWGVGSETYQARGGWGQSTLTFELFDGGVGKNCVKNVPKRTKNDDLEDV